MYIQVTIRTTELQEVLIALMADMGYEGFEQEEAELQAFIPEEEFDARVLQTLLLDGYGLTHQHRKIEDKNWNEEWEKNFEPVDRKSVV